MLDHGQLRAVFVLIAHRPTTGASAPYLATTLCLDMADVQVGLLDLAGRGLIVNPGKRPWVYKTATLIYDFNTGQAGDLFDEVYRAD